MTSWRLCEILGKNCTRIAETIGRAAQQNMITERPEITPEYLESQGLSLGFPARFWKRVKMMEGCWDWLAYKDRNGYGTIKTGINGKTIKAHRASYILNIGPIPEGMLVCHRCDCPSCSNFLHLFVGTNAENTHDSMNKGRKPCGEKHWNAKLSNEAVLEILETETLHRYGTVIRLAHKFGVDRHVITGIKNGKFWRHISRA